MSPFISKNKVEIQVIFRDITESKKAEHLAYFDSITGLATRTLFEKFLNKSLLLAERQKKYIAVVFIDLDDFKNVNDSLEDMTQVIYY